ncbi:v-type proton atpase subunit a [Anaeramoeba flamelloides]|uniref:V-type proton ATPase subunit a n=1 Tax=Anaeramoeba flamelloides TaxID=1746091 RepID=A0ABQ8XZI7_9EUKA|nr:v-type proton atpase subunit a [Anaeramoeba flamelloides]
MYLLQFILRNDCCEKVVTEIGRNSLVEFRDLNSGLAPNLRNFQNQVKKLDKMQRSVMKFHLFLKNEKIYKQMEKIPKLTKKEIKELNKSDINHLEEDIQDKTILLQDIQNGIIKSKEKLFHLYEFKSVYSNTNNFLKQRQQLPSRSPSSVTTDSDSNSDILLLERYDSLSLQSEMENDETIDDFIIKSRMLTGTIETKFRGKFQRSLWRITKGNSLVYLWDHEQKIFNPSVIDYGGDTTIINILNHEAKKLDQPTFLKCNKYQKPVQKLVNEYFIPKYRELNPTPVMTVTFPFLFAVMFSDLGHGILLTLVALYLIYSYKFLFNGYNQRKIKKSSIIYLLYKARYLLLYMGVASIIIGFIYNEIFGIPVSLFDSCWEKNDQNSTQFSIEYQRGANYCTYPVGVDPEWGNKENWLKYFNSFKLKISILLGFFHILIGLIIAIVNSIISKRYGYLVTQIFPKLLMIFSSHGYVCLLILYKWLTNWGDRKGQEGGINIIQTLLDMAFKFGNVEEEQEFFSNQQLFQKFLISFFFIGFILLFFTKPILQYLIVKNKINNLKNGDLVNFNNEENESVILQIIIDQVILVIEFALSILSNMASYTR